MQRSGMLLTLIALAIFSDGAQKDDFDIIDISKPANNTTQDQLAKLPYPGIDYVELKNDVLETDLLISGHFTLGTALGVDPGTLDDDQSLSFGHPLAKTSYPILEVDGQLYRLDTYYQAEEISFHNSESHRIGLTANNGILESILTIELDPQLDNMLQVSTLPCLYQINCMVNP